MDKHTGLPFTGLSRDADMIEALARDHPGEDESKQAVKASQHTDG